MFILGSSGKSMTSTMAARVVAKGYISWKTTTKEIFHDTVCIKISNNFFSDTNQDEDRLIWSKPGSLWCSSFVPKLNPGVLCQPWQRRSWPRNCCWQIPWHGGHSIINSHSGLKVLINLSRWITFSTRPAGSQDLTTGQLVSTSPKLFSRSQSPLLR